MNLSVVIITRRRPELLNNLLLSLTKQTRIPDEIVVVENDSESKIQGVLDEYRARLPIRYFLEPKVGVAFARNRGIVESKCDIIAFTDDDCEAHPLWAESMIRPFKTDPNIYAVGGRIEAKLRKGTLVEKYCMIESILANEMTDYDH